MKMRIRGMAGSAVCAALLLTGCGTSDDGAGSAGGKPGAGGDSGLAPIVGEWKEVSEDKPWTLRVSEDGALWTSDGDDTCEGPVQTVAAEEVPADAAPAEGSGTWYHFLAQADCGPYGSRKVPLRVGEEGGEARLVLSNGSGPESDEVYERVR